MLGFKVLFITVEVQKIDNSSLKIFGIVIANFQIMDKLDRDQFFQEMFLLANISIKMMLGIPFLTLSNTNI